MAVKILIIDDDVAFIKKTREVLEAKKYNVCSNLDMDENLDISATESPDLIILKILMCGCERCRKLLKKIEKKLEGNLIPIIAVTDTKRDKYLSGECYMDIDWRQVKNTLNKPVDASELLRCVDFTVSKQEGSPVKKL